MFNRALLIAVTLAVVVGSFAGDAEARRRFYGAYGYEGYYPDPDYIPPPPRHRRSPYYDPFYDDGFDGAYYDPYYDPPIHKIKPRKKKPAKEHPAVAKKTMNQPVATQEPAPLVVAPKKILPPPQNTLPPATAAAPEPATKLNSPLKSATAKLDGPSKLESPTKLNAAKVDTPSKLETPPKANSAAKTPSQAAKSKYAVSCDKAGSILAGYGFSAVTAANCSGQVYAFDATRDGKSYAIKLNAANGELTEVRKVR
jgi:hypothetical protein